MQEAGADRVGVTTAAPLTQTRVAIEQRVASGMADTMQFTFRNPVRSTTPEMSVTGAQSIIVAARSYYSDVQSGLDVLAGPEVSAHTPISARIARYAWRDHYEPLRDALRVAALRLKQDGHRATVFADDNSIVDREVAYRAGLGWYGKNANLLLDGLGSWFVLGCVVTTARLVPAETTVKDGCGSCSRCIDGCPTGAIVAPGVVDARKCLAWLVQKPGTFDVSFRAALGNRIYGCDECQEVCPPTVRRTINRSVGDERASVDALQLLTSTDEEVLRTADKWYVADRNPRWVRRNALIIVGNSGRGDSDEVASVLSMYLDGDDPLLAEHAQWAARQLGRHDLIDGELVK